MFDKLGVQLFSTRDFMKDEGEIRDTFRRLKSLGYDTAQTAGCQIPYADFAAVAKEEGIEIIGTHDDFTKMTENYDLALEEHNLLGAKVMGIGGWCSPETIDEVIAFAQKCNALASRLKKEGMTFSYHNHSFEFQKKYGDKSIFDVLVENYTDGANFCLDTYWAQYGGMDVRNTIEKLSGRISVLHLKDMAFGDNGPYITEIGNGNLWWEGILDAAEKAKVPYYIVEQDYSDKDIFKSLEISSNYLHKGFIK